MNPVNLKFNLNVCHKSVFQHEKPSIRVVITEAMSYIARSLAYRILGGDVFGEDQDIILSLFDDSDVFLESVSFELAACASNLLKDVTYSKDPEKAFKDADFIFLIGKARDYNFGDADLNSDPFFEESVLDTKNLAIAIEKYAQRSAKIITLGNTAARIISEYAPSIPKENITAVSLALLRVAASTIAKETNRVPSDVKNLIIWGANSKHAFPYCNQAKFKDGKSVIEEINDNEWFKKHLPKSLEKIFRKCRYRTSEALALADHCKFLIQGTPEGEFTCMSVISDGSYGVKPGIFFSFPVRCYNGNWAIMKDLHIEDYCLEIMKNIMLAIDEKISAALKICQRPDIVPTILKKTRRKSIIKIQFMK